jgi:hypothetical protein
MNVKVSYTEMRATATLAPNEELSLSLLERVVREVLIDPAGIWSVEVILSASMMNEHAEGLAALGFTNAGNLNEGNNTKIIMRKNLRQSSDGHAAAFDATRLAPTHLELTARRELSSKLDSHYSESAGRVADIERQAENLRTMRDDTVKTLFQSLDRRSAEILDRLKRLRRDPESAEVA